MKNMDVKDMLRGSAYRSIRSFKFPKKPFSGQKSNDGSQNPDDIIEFIIRFPGIDQGVNVIPIPKQAGQFAYLIRENHPTVMTCGKVIEKGVVGPRDNGLNIY